MNTEITNGIRSNRPLTEFACNCLGQFLTGGLLGTGTRSRGNTSVVFREEPGERWLQVHLFDEPILEVTLDPSWRVMSVVVGFTTFFDTAGNPSTTTRERLNGLLDRLGGYHVIPQGVRVFHDNFSGLTYLGKGDDRVAVGLNRATAVFITPNAGSFHFLAAHGNPIPGRYI